MEKSTEKRFINMIDIDPREVATIRITCEGKKRLFRHHKQDSFAYTLGSHPVRITVEDVPEETKKEDEK